MDERARDEERTGCSNSCQAEPAAPAPEPSLSTEANGPRAVEIAPAPRADQPRHPLLPRAASGGAGAVAALTTEALAPPVGALREPDGLLFQAGAPAQIAAKPLQSQAT
ncbi:MAG: hypothetical protein J2P51_17835, partial [Hyphomicrobiaceae bacterium]|nr:hypothetical protein [Hyphomicrobiaceae bacterium]